jgi:hypothetical protein
MKGHDMDYIIHYTETPDEIASNVEAVRATGGEMLDLMECTPEEYVEGWADLYVVTIDGAWSLGGVEPYEADTFPTRKAAEAWVAKYGDSEPGTWEVFEL